ncbi:MAG: hypothetical protein QM820_01205 [Minicystis sp.]
MTIRGVVSALFAAVSIVAFGCAAPVDQDEHKGWSAGDVARTGEAAQALGDRGCEEYFNHVVGGCDEPSVECTCANGGGGALCANACQAATKLCEHACQCAFGVGVESATCD